jgi:hypothetical protein
MTRTSPNILYLGDMVEVKPSDPVDEPRTGQVVSLARPDGPDVRLLANFGWLGTDRYVRYCDIVR